MKKLLLQLLAATLFAWPFAAALTSTDCVPKDAQTARDVTNPVLKAKDLACVMGSLLTDSRELADLCHLADILIPIVQKLVSVRDAARRAGVVYQPPVFGPDGGAVAP